MGRTVPLPVSAPDPDLYERITKAIECPRRLDVATIEWIERCLGEHRRVEDTLGSGPLLPVVRAQLDAITVLAQGAPRPLADRVVAMFGQYARAAMNCWKCSLVCPWP